MFSNEKCVPAAWPGEYENELEFNYIKATKSERIYFASKTKTKLGLWAAALMEEWVKALMQCQGFLTSFLSFMKSSVWLINFTKTIQGH